MARRPEEQKVKLPTFSSYTNSDGWQDLSPMDKERAVLGYAQAWKRNAIEDPDLNEQKDFQIADAMKHIVRKDMEDVGAFSGIGEFSKSARNAWQSKGAGAVAGTMAYSANTALTHIDDDLRSYGFEGRAMKPFPDGAGRDKAGFNYIESIAVDAHIEGLSFENWFNPSRGHKHDTLERVDKQLNQLSYEYHGIRKKEFLKDMEVAGQLHIDNLALSAESEGLSLVDGEYARILESKGVPKGYGAYVDRNTKDFRDYVLGKTPELQDLWSKRDDLLRDIGVAGHMATDSLQEHLDDKGLSASLAARSSFKDIWQESQNMNGFVKGVWQASKIAQAKIGSLGGSIASDIAFDLAIVTASRRLPLVGSNAAVIESSGLGVIATTQVDTLAYYARDIAIGLDHEAAARAAGAYSAITFIGEKLGFDWLFSSAARRGVGITGRFQKFVKNGTTEGLTELFQDAGVTMYRMNQGLPDGEFDFDTLLDSFVGGFLGGATIGSASENPVKDFVSETQERQRANYDFDLVRKAAKSELVDAIDIKEKLNKKSLVRLDPKEFIEGNAVMVAGPLKGRKAVSVFVTNKKSDENGTFYDVVYKKPGGIGEKRNVPAEQLFELPKGVEQFDKVEPVLTQNQDDLDKFTSLKSANKSLGSDAEVVPLDTMNQEQVAVFNAISSVFGGKKILPYSDSGGESRGFIDMDGDGTVYIKIDPTSNIKDLFQTVAHETFHQVVETQSIIAGEGNNSLDKFIELIDWENKEVKRITKQYSKNSTLSARQVQEESAAEVFAHVLSSREFFSKMHSENGSLFSKTVRNLSGMADKLLGSAMSLKTDYGRDTIVGAINDIDKAVNLAMEILDTDPEEVRRKLDYEKTIRAKAKEANERIADFDTDSFDLNPGEMDAVYEEALEEHIQLMLARGEEVKEVAPLANLERAMAMLPDASKPDENFASDVKRKETEQYDFELTRFESDEEAFLQLKEQLSAMPEIQTQVRSEDVQALLQRTMQDTGLQSVLDIKDGNTASRFVESLIQQTVERYGLDKGNEQLSKFTQRFGPDPKVEGLKTRAERERIKQEIAALRAKEKDAADRKAIQGVKSALTQNPLVGKKKILDQTSLEPDSRRTKSFKPKPVIEVAETNPGKLDPKVNESPFEKDHREAKREHQRRAKEEARQKLEDKGYIKGKGKRNSKVRNQLAPEERPTRHRVFEGGNPFKVKSGPGVLDARDTEKAYRLTGRPQLDDIKESGLIRAREGKMKGGRTGEVHWSRGHESLGYTSGEVVLVASASDLNNRDTPLSLDEMTAIYEKQGDQWVDILPQLKSERQNDGSKQQARDSLKVRNQLDPEDGNKNLRLRNQLVKHGSDSEAIIGELRTGERDWGWFGEGFYSTAYDNYARRWGKFVHKFKIPEGKYAQVSVSPDYSVKWLDNDLAEIMPSDKSFVENESRYSKEVSRLAKSKGYIGVKASFISKSNPEDSFPEVEIVVFDPKTVKWLGVEGVEDSKQQARDAVKERIRNKLIEDEPNTELQQKFEGLIKEYLDANPQVELTGDLLKHENFTTESINEYAGELAFLSNVTSDPEKSPEENAASPERKMLLLMRQINTQLRIGQYKEARNMMDAMARRVAHHDPVKQLKRLAASEIGYKESDPHGGYYMMRLIVHTMNEAATYVMQTGDEDAAIMLAGLSARWSLFGGLQSYTFSARTDPSVPNKELRRTAIIEMLHDISPKIRQKLAAMGIDVNNAYEVVKAVGEDIRHENEFVKDYLKQNGFDVKDLDGLSEHLKDPVEFAKFGNLISQAKNTVDNTLFEWFVSSILGGIPTTIVNMTNVIETMWETFVVQTVNTHLASFVTDLAHQFGVDINPQGVLTQAQLKELQSGIKRNFRESLQAARASWAAENSLHDQFFNQDNSKDFIIEGRKSAIPSNYISFATMWNHKVLRRMQALGLAGENVTRQDRFFLKIPEVGQIIDRKEFDHMKSTQKAFRKFMRDDNLGGVVRLPLRNLTFMDELIRQISYRSMLDAQIMVHAADMVSQGQASDIVEASAFLREDVTSEPNRKASEWANGNAFRDLPPKGTNLRNTIDFVNRQRTPRGLNDKGEARRQNALNDVWNNTVRFNIPFLNTPYALIHNAVFRKTPVGAAVSLVWGKRSKEDINKGVMIKRDKAVADLTKRKKGIPPTNEEMKSIEYALPLQETMPFTHVTDMFLSTIGYILFKSFVGDEGDEDKWIKVTGTGEGFIAPGSARKERGFRRQIDAAPLNSVKIGDGPWIDISRLDPYNAPLMFFADLRDEQLVEDLLSGDILEATKDAASFIGKSWKTIKEKSYFEGMDNIARLVESVVSGDEKKMGRVVQNYLADLSASMVPNLYRHYQTYGNANEYSFDQVKGEDGEFFGQYKARLKARFDFGNEYRATVVDWLGRPVTRDPDLKDGGFLYNMVSPFKRRDYDSEVDPNRLFFRWNELNPNNKRYPSDPYPHMTELGEVSPKDWEQFRIYRGEIVLKAVSGMIEKHPDQIKNPTQKFLDAIIGRQGFEDKQEGGGLMSKATEIAKRRLVAEGSIKWVVDPKGNKVLVNRDDNRFESFEEYITRIKSER